MTNVKCEDCKDDGYLIAELSCGYPQEVYGKMAIQRCDHCMKLDTDDIAAEKAKEDGVKFSLVDGFYLVENQ
jgi:hypothetical protein